MRAANRFIALALLIFALTLALRAARGEASGAEAQPARKDGAGLNVGQHVTLPVRQSDVAGDYSGSDACAKCHESEHRQWARSLHIRMTKPVSEALIVADFENASFAAHGRAYRMETRDGRRYMSVSHGGRPFQTFEVQYTLGAKRFQGYLTRLPDGRMYVLPAFWHIAERRWIDWKEITPVPDGDHDLRQIWNVTCFNCHATNLDSTFDVASKTYETTWTEMGLGCESCHGPGRPHIALMEEWEKTPASKPSYDTRASNRALSATLKIFSPRTGDPRQVFDTCAYCHGNKNNLFLGFLPGRRMEDFALPFLVSQPMPADDPQGDFWPDGRASRFNRPQALTLSGCFMKGNVTCTNCHVAHGSRHEHSLKVPIAESDRLCTQCHESLAVAANVERHTHHPLKSPGSRCIECHMSNVNWRLLIRRRDHTFAAPVPEMTVKYGVPNACTECHDTRTPEWAAGTMDRWYGDRERRARAVQLADAFYLAGARDASSLPMLASLAVERSRGMLVRASAAEFIGQVYLAATGDTGQLTRSGPSQTSVDAGTKVPAYEGVGAGAKVPAYEGGRSHGPAKAGPHEQRVEAITPELTTRLVYSLVGALNDPEPTVRAVAVRSLGVIADRRGITPIVSRLRDDVRTVRSAAVEALLWMGISTLPGPAGAYLAKAQDEYSASLETFGDLVSNHAVRGWLASERGRQDEAARALDTAIALDPRYVRGHVYRGIVAARSGNLSEALKHWHSARKINPAYPNLGRLIEEAERRVAQPRD
jgi:predicted CXXCH cytochrome family protein